MTESRQQRRARERAERKAQGRPAPAVVRLVADYRRDAAGLWSARVEAQAGHVAPVVVVDQPSAHDAFHEVMDAVEAIEVETDRPVYTEHSLGGDTTAWAMHVVEEGFLDCVDPAGGRFLLA